LRYEAAGLDGIIAASFYEGVLPAALKALKYGHGTSIVPAISAFLADILPQGTDPLLVPVPLHWRRLQQRGHNQAALLSRAVTARTGLSTCDFLRRIRRTETQTKLNKRQREANVSGAFRWDGESLRGRTVFLIDDVTTTGATFSACARALRPACPAAIWGVAVAKKR
jgi:ComF family protein